MSMGAVLVARLPPVPTDRRLVDPTLLVLFAAFAMLGLIDGSLGTVWPDLRDEFARRDSAFGWIIGCLAGGYFCATVVSGHLADRVGVGTTLRTATATSAAALVVVAAGPGWFVVLIGFVVLGLGNGLLDATANAWVATTAGPREMGLVHGFYGVGAVGGPLVATIFVAGGDQWRAPFVVFLVAQLAVGTAILARGNMLDGTATSPEVASADPDAPDATRIMVLLLAWFAFYVGVEIGVGFWSYTMLTEARGAGEVAAGILVATFWFGLMAGRFGLAFVGDRIEPERLMSVASLVAVAAVGALWLDPAGLGALALLPTGAALAVMFPLAVNRTAVYLGAARAARAVGYQFAASSIGGIVLPAGIGVLVDRSDAGVMAPVAFFATVATGVLWSACRAVVRARS